MNSMLLTPRLFIFSIILCQFVPKYFAQKSTYEGFAQEYYFGRQYSSRAEAIGQCFVSLDGDASSMHFNPAGIGNLDGIEVSTTYTNPFYLLSDATKRSINIAVKINSDMALGLSRNSFDYNLKSYVTDNLGTRLDSFEDKITNNKIVFAYLPESTFTIGGSLGLSTFEIAGLTGNSLQLDFGVLKKFEFSRFQNNQSINLATTIRNPLGTQLELMSTNQSLTTIGLPIIMRSGVSYYYSSEKVFATLCLLKIIAATEYQTVFNTQHRFNKYSTGLEVSILEIIHIRGGYYTETTENYNNPKNKSQLEDITFGIGLTLPLNKLADLPVSLTLDYCSLPQPSYTVGQEWDNFNSYTASLRYILF
ncbi:hypothetical protein N9772_02110 [Bacteroidia bacterium]|nr:hypothetical protein [Bacteroidia bacterium]